MSLNYCACVDCGEMLSLLTKRIATEKLVSSYLSRHIKCIDFNLLNALHFWLLSTKNEEYLSFLHDHRFRSTMMISISEKLGIDLSDYDSWHHALINTYEFIVIHYNMSKHLIPDGNKVYESCLRGSTINPYNIQSYVDMNVPLDMTSLIKVISGRVVKLKLDKHDMIDPNSLFLEFTKLGIKLCEHITVDAVIDVINKISKANKKHIDEVDSYKGYMKQHSPK